LGGTQLSMKDYAAAEKTLDRLVTEFPQSDLVTSARFARGTARQQLGQFAEAIDDVQALLASGPSGKEKSDALYVLGLCQVGLKKNDEAVKTFEALLAEDPRYAGADKALYELGWALKDSGKGGEAADRFTQLATQYPSSPLAAEGLYHAAETKYDQKQFDAAAEAYATVAEKTTDPSLKEKALHKLAWSYFNQGQFDRAQDAFAGQQKTFPDGRLVADAAFMEGECLRHSGKLPEALAAYERMLDLSKKPLGEHFEVLVILHAGQIAGQLKQWEKSAALLARTQQAAPESPYRPEVLFEQGWAQENLGRLDEAAKLYRELVEKYPKSGKAAAAKKRLESLESG